MKIVNLIDNIEGCKGCVAEHGLCYYIETAKHKLLMDTGASGVFTENALVKGVDLSKVDTLVLSHGHYDHGGGIMKFAQMNPDAKIYIHNHAFEGHYHVFPDRNKYIGLDQRIAGLKQNILVKDDLKIDEELSIFGNVTGRTLWPEGNKELKVIKDDVVTQDNFDHEQYLCIEEGEKLILFSGCAHNGILNILEKFQKIYGREPYAVFSGFHMKKKEYEDSDIDNIKATARELMKTSTRFFTGHCTGEYAYQILKEIMKDQIHYVKCGEEIEI